MICSNCGAERTARSFRKYEKDFYACKNCGLIFQFPTPSPEDVARYYTRDYYTAWGTDDDFKGVEAARSVQQILDKREAHGEFRSSS